MEPHPFLCSWLRDPAVNRIKGLTGAMQIILFWIYYN